MWYHGTFPLLRQRLQGRAHPHRPADACSALVSDICWKVRWNAIIVSGAGAEVPTAHQAVPKRLSPIESFVLNAATAADEQQRPRKINSCFYKTPESHRPVQTSARREIVHIFRVYPPAQRRVRLSPIESFVLNAATAADEQQRPRKINSCFYKTPESHRPVQTSARREIVHIFRVYPPAQRRVRLSPIESFVLNAATAADEQQRPRKINSWRGRHHITPHHTHTLRHMVRRLTVGCLDKTMYQNLLLFAGNFPEKRYSERKILDGKKGFGQWKYPAGPSSEA